MVTSLPYGRQTLDEDDIAAVVEQLRGDWLTQGPAVARFEEQLSRLTGAPYVVAVSSGTAALHLACTVAGLKAGDVGLTSDITFVASANAIRYRGAEPSLIDVDPETGLMAVDALERRVDSLRADGRSPRVIVGVDFAGAVTDLVRVRRIAERSGAVLIEDAAHSLGATYDFDGRSVPAGSAEHAHMATLSFHPVKHITTGEGGAICTRDEALYRDLCELRTHGLTKDPTRLTRNDGPWYYEQHSLGYNYRITDIQCALGISQAGKLTRFVERRRSLAARYDRGFATSPLRSVMVPLRVPSRVQSSYHLYVVRLTRAHAEPLVNVLERRRVLYMALRDCGIYTQVHYIPVHRQPDFVAHGLSTGDFVGAEEYYAGCLSLPLFPAMSDADVDRVLEAIARVAVRERWA